MIHPVLAFTGHRPNKLGGYEPCETHARVRSWIAALIAKYQPSRVITGMALGVDQFVAEVCVTWSVPFVAAVPFEGQEGRWPEKSVAHYRELLSKATDVVVVSEGPFAPWKLQRRNEWMVDNCQLLGAVWDGSTGGTASCVAYAQRVGREIVRVRPEEL